MHPELTKKRKKVHDKVVFRIAESVSTLCAFVVIFFLLVTVSNWPAYSRMVQDTITINEPELVIEKPVWGGFHQQKEWYHLEDLELYPSEMYLEIPQVFSGAIPVKNVEVKGFELKDLYASENAIQKVLREGVVHYPYTAYPDQFGNVFITGHSSYYPWDKGRYKEIFALLYKLKRGDRYAIYYKGNKYYYEVKESFETVPDDVSVLEQPTDQKVSTLMTCTPVGTTLRRLIVRADLIPQN